MDDGFAALRAGVLRTTTCLVAVFLLLAFFAAVLLAAFLAAVFFAAACFATGSRAAAFDAGAFDMGVLDVDVLVVKRLRSADFLPVLFGFADFPAAAFFAADLRVVAMRHHSCSHRQGIRQRSS